LPTCSFRDLQRVCQSLGLQSIQKKKGISWEGISPLNNEFVQIVIHEHAGGRDIPMGTLRKYIRDLGFKDFQAYMNYLNQQ
jgi:hypothetical protein